MATMRRRVIDRATVAQTTARLCLALHPLKDSVRHPSKFWTTATAEQNATLAVVLTSANCISRSGAADSALRLSAVRLYSPHHFRTVRQLYRRHCHRHHSRLSLLHSSLSPCRRRQATTRTHCPLLSISPLFLLHRPRRHSLQRRTYPTSRRHWQAPHPSSDSHVDRRLIWLAISQVGSGSRPCRRC